jgi:glyoxylase-like metal-dependent hydrolase (beta-lactamase superfamily II)
MRTAAVVFSFVLVGCGSSGTGADASETSSNGTGATDDAVTKGDEPEASGADVEESSADDPTAPTTVTVGEDSTTASVTTDTGVEDSTGTSTGGERACTGEFPAMWTDGTDCSEPEIMVHVYDEDTYILRQSLCTSFEGPFLFLLFGEDRVLLEDTGDGGIDLSGTVYGIIDDWLAAHGKESIELVVVNSHAHGDHVAGNPMFTGVPGTTLVTPSVAGLTSFFGIDDWPNQAVEFDLGGRVVDVIPIPGHQTSHIALFDRNEGLLLTGDTLYPGRLYIDDPVAYAESIHRLVDTVPEADVCHVIGTHIEMTQMPGVDYPFGADSHANEHVLELSWAHVLELRDAVDSVAYPTYEEHDDFILYPL